MRESIDLGEKLLTDANFHALLEGDLRKYEADRGTLEKNKLWLRKLKRLYKLLFRN